MQITTIIRHWQFRWDHQSDLLVLTCSRPVYGPTPLTFVDPDLPFLTSTSLFSISHAGDREWRTTRGAVCSACFLRGQFPEYHDDMTFFDHDVQLFPGGSGAPFIDLMDRVHGMQSSEITVVEHAFCVQREARKRIDTYRKIDLQTVPRQVNEFIFRLSNLKQAIPVQYLADRLKELFLMEEVDPNTDLTLFLRESVNSYILTLHETPTQSSSPATVPSQGPQPSTRPSKRPREESVLCVSSRNTSQSITLPYFLLRQEVDRNPMVRKVNPTNLVRNWEAEIMNWIEERVRLVTLCESTQDDVLSSFNSFASPRSHRQALAALTCKRWILSSGKPLPNDLEEFFAINFTNPRILGGASYHRSYFQKNRIPQTQAVSRVLQEGFQEQHVMENSLVNANRGISNNQLSSSKGNRDFGLWQGHVVNPEFVCLLDHIMHKYPNTFKHFSLKNKKLCTMNLNMLCTSLIDFAKISMSEVDSELIVEYRDVFAYLQNQGFNISWLVNRLNYIDHLRFSKPLVSELEAKSKLQDLRFPRMAKMTEIQILEVWVPLLLVLLLMIYCLVLYLHGLVPLTCLLSSLQVFSTLLAFSGFVIDCSWCLTM